MNQAKKKIEDGKKSKDRIKGSAAKPIEVMPPRPQLALAWREELSLLKSKSFESLDEALKCIIDLVLVKLKLGDDQTIRENLKVVIMTDLKFSKEIEKLVKGRR